MSAATVAISSSLYTDSYCSVAASVLFIYDAFITFDREVACFWTAKRTGASLLFFANKGISMTAYVMVLASLASFPSDESCSIFAITAYAILILQFLPGAAFSALRAFVLSESKPLGILVFALSLAPVGANLATYGYQYSGEHSQPFGCFGVDDTTVALELRLTIISRVPIILSDILLIYITWTKLSTRGALMGIRWSKRLSLSDILFRGGDIYFIILSILNVLHLVLTSLALADASVTGESEVPTFTVPITGILISRFLLELQETNQMVVRVDPEDPLHSSRNPYDSTPSFIVSLGGLVHSDQPARSDDEGVKLQVHSRARSEVAEEEQGGSQAESLQASASSSCSA